MKTWKELMDTTPNEEIERVLIQCLIELSSHPTYQSMTPWEILDRQVELAAERAF